MKAYLWIFSALLAVYATVKIGYTLTGGSIDFVSHLSLVDYIASTGHAPLWNSFQDQNPAPYMGAMSFYPPIAHFIAAFLGRVLNSEINGMLAAGGLSIFIFYSFAMYLVTRAGSIFGTFVFLAVILAFYPWRVFHGDELIGNFFFAQAVGTAAMLASLYLCVVRLEGYRAIFAAVISAYILAWTYLFSEIEFCACFTIAMALRLLSRTKEDQGYQFRSYSHLLLTILLLSAVTLLHPQFGIMRSISANDGAIDPSISLTVLAFLAFALILMCICFYAKHYKTFSSHNLLLTSLGLSTPILFTLQYTALKTLHLGSTYAVRKYTFDLFTLMAMVTSCFLGLWTSNQTRYLRISMNASSLFAISFALITTFVIYRTTPTDNSYAVSSLANFEKQLVDLQMPPDAYGHTASNIHGLAPTLQLDSILNLALEQIVFHDSIEDGFAFSFKNDFSKARYVVVSSEDELASNKKCFLSTLTHLDIIAIDYKCATDK